MPNIISLDRCGENVDTIKVNFRPENILNEIFNSHARKIGNGTYVVTTRSNDGTVVDMQTFVKKGRAVYLYQMVPEGVMLLEHPKDWV